jgi:hypothetical protein
MSSNPYENEPGFEDASEPSDKKNQKDYIAKVRFWIMLSPLLMLTDFIDPP